MSIFISLQPGLIPPKDRDLDVIKSFLVKMQRAYSPLKKLENLMGATGAIYQSVSVEMYLYRLQVRSVVAAYAGAARRRVHLATVFLGLCLAISQADARLVTTISYR